MRHEGEMKSWRSPFSLSVYKAFCSKDEFCRNTNLTEQQCLLTKASHFQELWMLVSYRFTGGTSGLNNCNTFWIWLQTVPNSPVDLQKQNRQAAVSWVESSSGPPNKPTWTMTCKSELPNHCLHFFLTNFSQLMARLAVPVLGLKSMSLRTRRRIRRWLTWREGRWLDSWRVPLIWICDSAMIPYLFWYDTTIYVFSQFDFFISTISNSTSKIANQEHEDKYGWISCG